MSAAKLLNFDAIDVDEGARKRWRHDPRETFVFSTRCDEDEPGSWHQVHSHTQAAAEEERTLRVKWGWSVTKIRHLAEVTP